MSKQQNFSGSPEIEFVIQWGNLIGPRYDIGRDAMISNLFVSEPIDVIIKSDSVTAFGNYYISEFIIALFQASAIFLQQRRKTSIHINLGAEKNYLDIDGGDIILCLWDSAERCYKQIKCNEISFLSFLASIKSQFCDKLRKTYVVESLRDYRYFCLGFYNLLK